MRYFLNSLQLQSIIINCGNINIIRKKNMAAIKYVEDPMSWVWYTTTSHDGVKLLLKELICP